MNYHEDRQIKMGDKQMRRLTEPEFTRNGYPTEDTLETIRHWPIAETGLESLLRFIQTAWEYPNMMTEQNGLWMFSTGGWSGNEELIDAFEALPWRNLAKGEASFIGGHYVIALTSEAARFLLQKIKK